MRTQFIALVTIAVFALHSQAAEPLPSVLAEYHNLPREVQLDGLVEAVNQGTVSAQTQGEVIGVAFDVDDRVEEGEVILRIKDTRQKAALSQAEAEADGAAARLAAARDEHRRVKEVFAKQMVSQAELDRAEAALKAAVAALQAAVSGVDGAREQLEYTLIRAPYSGIVTQRHIELGETASPGMAVMSGISLQPLRVLVDVPQRLVRYLREHGQARVLTADGGELEVEELAIFPFADPLGNSFRVRLRLSDGVEGLAPGMYVKTSFVIGDEDVLLIPQRAVVYRSEVTAVYVVDPAGEVRFRRIRPGHQVSGGQLVVRAGLEEGERVATDPIRAGALLKQQMGDKGHG